MTNSIIIHDAIVDFFIIVGLFLWDLFFMWWLNWFNDNYEIRKKNDK